MKELLQGGEEGGKKRASSRSCRAAEDEVEIWRVCLCVCVYVRCDGCINMPPGIWMTKMRIGSLGPSSKLPCVLEEEARRGSCGEKSCC